MSWQEKLAETQRLRYAATAAYQKLPPGIAELVAYELRVWVDLKWPVVKGGPIDRAATELLRGGTETVFATPVREDQGVGGRPAPEPFPLPFG